MQRICVYCGSNPGRGDAYARAARELAEALVSNSLELVYGGAHKGTMGVLADAVLEFGGVVHGVIPKMLERKSMMAALSDGFVALPGGFGTLEELVEMVTWGQLHFHEKPCGVLNVNGYFDKLLEFFDHMQAQGFLKRENRAMLLADDTANGLLGLFERYEPPATGKWL